MDRQKYLWGRVLYDNKGTYQVCCEAVTHNAGQKPYGEELNAAVHYRGTALYRREVPFLATYTATSDVSSSKHIVRNHHYCFLSVPSGFRFSATHSGRFFGARVEAAHRVEGRFALSNSPTPEAQLMWEHDSTPHTRPHQTWQAVQ
jgi:hypothetical protein